MPNPNGHRIGPLRVYRIPPKVILSLGARMALGLALAPTGLIEK